MPHPGKVLRGGASGRGPAGDRRPVATLFMPTCTRGSAINHGTGQVDGLAGWKNGPHRRMSIRCCGIPLGVPGQSAETCGQADIPQQIGQAR